MDDELIQFKGVTKRFGKNVVLDEIDLVIPEGKITGIIGASGEGKSTILKMMASFYKPNKGKIYYLRREISKDRKRISKFFGMAIEDGSFYEKLSVRENLFHFGRLYHVKRKDLAKRVDELLDLVGLKYAENTLSEELSVGMKKRLDIACSLVHNPSILILDEPTADLDPLLRAQMIHLLKKINSHGTTIVMTTQLLEEVDEICDKLAILFNEKIVEQDTPNKIKSKYNSKDLDSVFKKIFSHKSRKTYQESTKKKSGLKLLNKSKLKKKSLIPNVSKFKKDWKTGKSKKSFSLIDKKLDEMEGEND